MYYFVSLYGLKIVMNLICEVAYTFAPSRHPWTVISKITAQYICVTCCIPSFTSRKGICLTINHLCSLAGFNKYEHNKYSTDGKRFKFDQRNSNKRTRIECHECISLLLICVVGLGESHTLHNWSIQIPPFKSSLSCVCSGVKFCVWPYSNFLDS